jgi:hypothetical protein
VGEILPDGYLVAKRLVATPVSEAAGESGQELQAFRIA